MESPGYLKRIHRPLGWAALFALFIVATASPDAAVESSSRATVAGAISGSLADSVINLKQWKSADGGNDHWYGILAVLHDWLEADSIAPTLMLDTITGYLATIKSSAENDFIFDSILPGADPPSVQDQFFLGGEEVSGLWIWSTGELFCYENWETGEPNYADEKVLSIWGPAQCCPVPIPPGSWNNTIADDSSNPFARFWAIVEWGSLDSTELPICANAILECGEECDDGNTIDGDVNMSASVNSGDIICLVAYVFKGGASCIPRPCQESGDVNCNSSVTSADIIYLVSYVFRSGPPPCNTCAVCGS